LEHEYAHFIEENITPDFKARLFDNDIVMGYRGRNINEKLANMIQDGKLPKEITDAFPNLPKTKAQLTDIWNKAQAPARAKTSPRKPRSSRRLRSLWKDRAVLIKIHLMYIGMVLQVEFYKVEQQDCI